MDNFIKGAVSILFMLTSILPIKAYNSDDVFFFNVPNGYTMYRLAKVLDVKADTLYKYNPKLRDGLQAGTQIYLPAVSVSEKNLKKIDASPTFVSQALSSVYSNVLVESAKAQRRHHEITNEQSAPLEQNKTTNAQSVLSAKEYSLTVQKLADELKTKLEKIQKSNSIWKQDWQKYPDEAKLWGAAEYALEKLSAVKNAYIKPNSFRTGTDVNSKSYLHNVIIENGKGFYIMGDNINRSPNKYRETSALSFYDPSGRKINCQGQLLTFEQLKGLFKSSECEVLYRRESTPGINVLNSGKNKPQGASYSNWPYAWLLKSSYTDEVIRLPFGTFWTSTPSDGGYQCITVNVMAAHDYDEVVLSKTDEAISLYAVELDYTQLLNWYKESLDYLMRDVNKLLGEQENRKRIQENAFEEADKTNLLGKLLVETASKLKADKSLFDYVITETASTYDISIIANNNTLRFAKEFWNKLNEIGESEGNICLYYHGKQGGRSHYTYNIAANEKDNKIHIRNLLDRIVDSSKSNIYSFVNSYFRPKGKLTLKIQNCDEFSIYGVNPTKYGDEGVNIPCLDLHEEKGHILYTLSINKDNVSLLTNVKNKDYNVKIKK